MKFEVLPPRESDEKAVYYGELAGTFQMACYKGTKVNKGEAPSIKENPDRDIELAAITRGMLLVGRTYPGSLSSLQDDLRDRKNVAVGARCMIVEGGEQGKKAVQRFDFKYDYPEPVHVMNLRYWARK